MGVVVLFIICLRFSNFPCVLIVCACLCCFVAFGVVLFHFYYVCDGCVLCVLGLAAVVHSCYLIRLGLVFRTLLEFH